MGAYGLYAAFALVSLVVVMRFVVETRRRTLEEMGTSVEREVASFARRTGAKAAG
jgi:hypothetical protein